ncbi:MAG TPA: DUF1476 domain-containing protein [Stellaceae bacterium]|nr:DUF1476 domain-containing protein [Stellaceae bacterium]
MSMFEDREKGFERKFQQEQELAFKVKARRNKLIGLWAAERLGLAGAAAEHYAQEVMEADLQHPGPHDIVAKIAADFTQRGVPLDESRIRAQLDLCAAEATKQIEGGR